jgi:hypothetical protein
VLKLPRDRHQSKRSSAAFCLAALVALLAGFGVQPVAAQQAVMSPPPMVVPPPLPPGPPSTGIEILATPYLWFPWTSATITPSRVLLPSASSTIGPGDLIDHITWVPFMGSLEVRDGQWGFLADFIHAPLKSGISTRQILFNGASGNITLDAGTAMFLYRPIQSSYQYLDVGLGMRAWGLSGGIALSEGLLPPLSVSSGLSWADPLISLRYHRELGNGFSTTVYGDLGGFGIGAHVDWQLLGTIDYAWRPGIDLHVGFRSLNFNYGAQQAGFNTNMYGPLIAATIRF